MLAAQCVFGIGQRTTVTANLCSTRPSQEREGRGTHFVPGASEFKSLGPRPSWGSLSSHGDGKDGPALLRQVPRRLSFRFRRQTSVDEASWSAELATRQGLGLFGGYSCLLFQAVKTGKKEGN